MIKHIVSLTAACLILSACESNWFAAEPEPPLVGERLSLLDFEKSLQPEGSAQFGMEGLTDQNIITLPEALSGGVDENILIPTAWQNRFWPQVGGYPNHTMKHLALNEGALKRVWKTSIGYGSSSRSPLTTSPIIADSRVFTMDSRNNVQATDAQGGHVLWDRSVQKKNEDETVIGGGLAYSAGRLFVTNGFNEVLALDPENGEILWRTELIAPVRAAPSAIPGRIFVVTMDNQTIALDAQNGAILWHHTGTTETASVLGAATPAITRDTVLTAYSSGSIHALRIENGMPLWSDNLSPLARSSGKTTLSSIRALPVIDEGTAYAVSVANRIAAISMRNGTTKWQANIGSATTPFVSGNRLFMIGHQGTLISLDRENGSLLWQTSIPRYQDPEDRDGVIQWQGPIMAGKRLMIFSSEGKIRDYNPSDGRLIREWDFGRSILLSPAIANGILYIVSDDGTLSAWR